MKEDVTINLSKNLQRREDITIELIKKISVGTNKRTGQILIMEIFEKIVNGFFNPWLFPQIATS